MQILRPWPRGPESETLGRGPAICFNKTFRGDSEALSSLTTTVVSISCQASFGGRGNQGELVTRSGGHWFPQKQLQEGWLGAFPSGGASDHSNKTK